jgi:hypothetical protein
MDVGKTSYRELQSTLLAAGLVPVIPLVHPPGHPVVPASMEGHAKELGHGRGVVLRRKDPSGPIPLEVDEEKVERVESTTLQDRLDVRLEGDELPKFSRSSSRHVASLGSGSGRSKPGKKSGQFASAVT